MGPEGSAIRLIVAALACSACWLLTATAQAKTTKVTPSGGTQGIQNPSPAASPGDTIAVGPGTSYSGPTVSVATSDLTIKGSKAAIIDATGNTYGITVGTKLTFDEGPLLPRLRRQQLQDHRSQRPKRR